MKRLHFTRANNLNQLHEEIVAAVPSVRPQLNAFGEQEAVMTVEGKGDDIWLTVPDDADETAISTVVTAHVPREVPPVDPDGDLRAAIVAVDTSKILDPSVRQAFEDLKAALTGSKNQPAAAGRVVKT